MEELNRKLYHNILINLLIILSGVIPIIILFSVIQDVWGMVVPQYTIPVWRWIIFCLNCMFSVIYMLPTLIVRSKWKYIFWIINIFVSWTIIGWILLLVLSMYLNKLVVDN